MATSFMSDTGSTYLKEAAEYLEARCLTIQDCPIKPIASKNHGLSTKDGVAYPLQGWAFMVKGPDGEPDDTKPHLRVCNYPEKEALYFVRGKLAVVYPDRPKFIQMFKGEFLHFTRPQHDICHANVVMLHEKITSAELATKFLGLPGLAISGCAGWSKGGLVGPELEHTIKNMAIDAKLLVCFDGDISYKPGIQEAAKGLKGWIKILRPDISVIFLEVPENERGVGWDDWAMCQGDELAANWAVQIINQQTGVEITDFVPPGFLIQEYQLETKEDKFGNVSAVHTLDNYMRLTRYPKWANLSIDISNQIYDTTDIDAGPKDFDSLVIDFRTWLETSAYRGNGETVRSSFAKDALSYLLSTKRISVPLMLLERQEEVTEEQAYAASNRLITEGLKVTGPLKQEHTAETLIRMARDIVSLWSLDSSVDVQWACALVGPSGCGKSNFPHSFIDCFSEWGYRPRVGKLAKDGTKAELSELYKACRDNLIGVFDEYNPADGNAKQVEQNIFTLSTTRTTDVRELYREFASECTRHASIFLTTVDTNRGYIRSSKGDGERRFITFEVVGTHVYYGRITSRRDIIKDCGAILLRYGYQLFTSGDKRSATEFSESTASDYISESTIIGKLSKRWASSNTAEAVKRFHSDNVDKDSRMILGPTTVYNWMMGEERFSRQEQADLKQMILDAGADLIGAGRVKGVMKDNRLHIQDWDLWVDHMFRKL